MQSPFDAMTIVSPAKLTGEEKNQDRAGWHASARTATVCDGTSSSPHAELAAEAGVEFGPALFFNNPSSRDDVFGRLAVLCDILVAKRLARRQAVIDRRNDHADPMQRMLQQVVEQKLTQGFQTTLAAIQLLPIGSMTQVTGVTCGDASIAAFEADGVPLLSSLDGLFAGENKAPISDIYGRRAFYFGPGAELLVKVRGRANSNEALQRAARIRPSSANRWLVAEPLDQHAPNMFHADLALHEHHLIARGDRLMIPTYLTGLARASHADTYLQVPYSQCIRIVRAKSPAIAPVPDRTNVTCVLPDHRGEKYWTYFQENLPAEAQVVVASDGFTNSFSSSGDAWRWLKQNESALASPEKRVGVLQELHAQLHGQRGDDDISFVWVRPRP